MSVLQSAGVDIRFTQWWIAVVSLIVVAALGRLMDIMRGMQRRGFAFVWLASLAACDRHVVLHFSAGLKCATLARCRQGSRVNGVQCGHLFMPCWFVPLGSPQVFNSPEASSSLLSTAPAPCTCRCLSYGVPPLHEQKYF